MEVGLRSEGARGVRSTSEGDTGDGSTYISFRGPPSQTPESPLAGGPRARRFLRGERSNSCSSPSTATITYRSPVLHHQTLLTSSCSQLEAMGASITQQQSTVPDILVRPSTPSSQGPGQTSPLTASSADSKQNHSQGTAPPHPPLYLRRRAGKGDGDAGSLRQRENEGFLGLVRSHSEPGLGSSTDTVDFGSGSSKEAYHTSTDTAPGSEACLLPRTSLPPATALPRKGSIKSVSTGGHVPSKPSPTSPRRLPKDCHRSLGDLKVTRVLVARFLQRSKRNLAPSTEHAGSNAQGSKRRGLSEGTVPAHGPPEQVLRAPWNNTRAHPIHRQPHHRGHHHSHSDSRHNRSHSTRTPEGIHLRSCGDLSSSSSLRRLVTPHGSSGALYSESAL